jgi:hypothetical protein
MEKLLAIAGRARMRIRLNGTLHSSTKWLLYLAIVSLLIALTDRVGDVSFIPWIITFSILGTLSLIVILIQWNFQSISKIEAATEVDQRMHLRDRISSAIACGHSDDPYCVALMNDATEVVAIEKVEEKLAHYFPIMYPRKFGSIIAVAIATTLVIWSPQWGMWNDQGNDTVQASLIPTRDNIEASIDAVLEQIREDEALGQSLESELAELESVIALDDRDPELLRREALRKMTDIQKRLDELLQGENTLTFEEISRRLQTLELPRDSETLPLVAALKNGDFNKAKKELEALQEQMESSDLSDEEREELAKALAELGDKLEDLASASDALASAMSAAGMNGALASNPDAAMKAIKNAKNLNEEQKKKLLEMLKAQQKAGEACQNMGSAMKNFAKGEGSSEMANELEQLQAVQMFKTKAQMAKVSCQNAAGAMCSKPGSGNGNNTGGEGKGNGGMNRVEETETSNVAHRSPVHSIDGTIIARQLFEGGLLTTSESIAAVRETVLTERRSVEQAITDEEVPRKYHDLLRHYFGQLEELTEPSVEETTESSD